MQFLIVDDSESPLKLLRRVIEDAGHEIVGEASDGQEALRKFAALLPDAVVMDVIMPRMNGLDALREIRRIDPQAKVVMACSMKSCQTALAAGERGASFFLVKPFHEQTLRNVIEKLVGQCGDNSGKVASPA